MLIWTWDRFGTDENNKRRKRRKEEEKKIPIQTIFDDNRNLVNEKLERIHLITRQDEQNIKEEYNINSDGILDSNDVLRVTKWVEGLKNREDSPVVLFKDENIFDEELYPGMKAGDFLLVIMNASQEDMLRFYGNDTICLDFTHGMNAYGFDSATLLVLDDKKGISSSIHFKQSTRFYNRESC
ncbi:uncharacterized protein TNCT_210451 [Trichonephila clavata]|uniref:Uncharacterized protein n=1 Tax=Trichonephila clavata TaxID=2740835 RepID=A0A8X6G3P3_TRICU|nr:uncharacterized protein TNCT_210451 [Trichonephila clavata]